MYFFRAHALQSVVQLMGEKELYEFWSDTYKVHHIDWTQEKAALVLDTWQRQFSSVLCKKNLKTFFQLILIKMLFYSISVFNIAGNSKVYET